MIGPSAMRRAQARGQANDSICALKKMDTDAGLEASCFAVTLVSLLTSITLFLLFAVRIMKRGMITAFKLQISLL